MFWMQILAGGVTGLVVGMTGVGGGALMTPILVLVFGATPLAAVGTDLWFAALTKIVAAKAHHSRALIDWPIVKWLWMGSLPASALTMLLLRVSIFQVHETRILKVSIAGAILLTAVGLLLQKTLLNLRSRSASTEPEGPNSLQGPITVGAGFILGALVTLTSVGAGALGAVFLVYLYPRRLPPHRLIATDIAHAIPLAMFAGMTHLFMGNIDFVLLGTLLIGSIPGAMIGVRLSSRLPQALLRGILAVTLLFIGVRLWISAG